LIANPPGLDMFTFYILQNREINAPLFIKGLDYLGRVVSHADDTYTKGVKLIFQVIQFHELTNAEGSPIHRAVEDKQQSIGTA